MRLHQRLLVTISCHMTAPLGRAEGRNGSVRLTAAGSPLGQPVTRGGEPSVGSLRRHDRALTRAKPE